MQVKYKETVILLVIAIILAGFIYVYERHTIGTSEKLRRMDRILPEFMRGKVTKIEIKSEKGHIIAIKRKPEGKKKGEEEAYWELVKPVRAKADKVTIDGILSDLEYMTQERKIKGSEAKLESKFGIDRPTIVIRLWQGDRLFELKCGKEAPGEGIYLKRKSYPDIVYVISKATSEGFIKEPIDFRDKQITDILPGEMKTIKIFEGDKLSRKFERIKEKWKISYEENGFKEQRADRDEVRKLGSKLGSIRATNFLADGVKKKKISDYGITSESTKIEVETEKGKKTTLYIGEACGGETKGTEGVALYIEGGTTISCVSKELSSIVRRSAEDYVLKKAVEFDEYDLYALESYYDGALTFRVEKEDDKWKLKKPKEREVDSDSIKSLVEFLRKEKVDQMVDVQDERIPSDLKEEGKEKIKLVFFDSANEKLESLAMSMDGEKTLYFKRQGEGYAGIVKSAGTVESCWKDFYYYKKSVVGKDYYLAVSYSVEGRESGFFHKLEKDIDEGKWRMIAPESIPVDGGDARDTIETFSSLSAQRFIAESSEQNLSDLGLSQPSWIITASFKGEGNGGESKKELREKVILKIGKKFDGDWSAVIEKEGDRLPVFLITDSVLERLTRPLADRNVFQIDSSNLSQVKLWKGRKMEVFTKRGDLYSHSDGIEGLFEEEKVKDFVDKLSNIRAEDVISYNIIIGERELASPFLKAEFIINQDDEGEKVKNKYFIVVRRVENEKEKFYAISSDLKCSYTLGRDLFEVLGIVRAEN